MKIREKLQHWYEGTYIPEPPSSPFTMGGYRRHWSSKLFHSVKAFYLANWQWIWTTSIAFIALHIAVLALR
jgi:hypothetical protein